MGFHLFPCIILLVDVLFFSPPWKVGSSLALAWIGGVFTCYWVWLKVCFEINGFWPYPVIDKMGIEARWAAFVGMMIATWTIWLGLRELHTLVESFT